MTQPLRRSTCSCLTITPLGPQSITRPVSLNEEAYEPVDIREILSPAWHVGYRHRPVNPTAVDETRSPRTPP